VIGEVIKEYLVSLGVQIDRPGFTQMQSTLNQTSGTVASATSGWTKNFVTAGTIIGTALASVTASIAGVMTAAAKQDLSMEKYARNMLISKSAALEMKTAMDALGESVQDIQLTPELMGRYRALVSDGRNMKVGGDYEGTMKNFRDLIFEFTRLKQEASYALQWVGYYLMKHLSKPLADAKESFRSFNDNLIKTMPVWTEKVARALVYVINIGKHFLELLKSIGKSIYEVWDAFPRGIKIATAALAGFFMLLRASPLGRMLALVSSLLLLVDDYFGYMEGKQAAMGSVWDKLNAYMEIAKQKMTEWGEKLEPIWDSFVGYLETARSGVVDLAGTFSDWIQEIQQSKEVNEFVAVIKELGSAFYDLGSGIVELVADACKDLLASFKGHDIATKFTDLMERLKGILWALLEALGDCIETLGKWFSEIAKSEGMQDLIDAVVELVGALLDLFNALIDLVTVAFSGFFGELGKTQKAYTFREAVRAVVGVISAMVRIIADVIESLAKFFKMMADNRLFKEFWKGIAQAVKVFGDVVFGVIASVGKLGQALLALVRGDYKQAMKLAGDALFGKAEAEGKRDNWQGGHTEGLGDGETAAEPYIQEAAKQYNLNPNLLRALIKQESGFQPGIVSPAGAIGYSQLMPETAKGLGVNPWDPHENILGGAEYLRQQLDTFNGDIEKALAAYNAGPQAVIDYKGIPPYAETRNYVDLVLANLQNYEQRTVYDEQRNNNNKESVTPDQPVLKNPPEGMHEPTWIDRYQEWWQRLLQSSAGAESDTATLARPSSYLVNGFANADPMLLSSLMGGSYPAYAQSSGSVINITNHVEVGGVEVANTNASSQEIGRAVGKETVSSLNDRATYVLQNRVLNGIQA
jgi:hypothetical protein